MTLHMVTCPLCCQPGFNTSDALCSALIGASTRKLFCPVCNDVLIGLDKLAVHLFGHKTCIKNPTDGSSMQNPLCQGKFLVTHNSTDVDNAVIAPVLYIQSENGQVFGLCTNPFVNQFETVTINTQNHISSTSACENKFFDAQNSSSVGTNSEKTPEYSSCKDLLTSGDFSEPFDENDVGEPSCSMKADGGFLNTEPQSDGPPGAHENLRIDEDVIEAPSKSVPGTQATDELALVESESPKPLIPCDVCEMRFSNKAIMAVHKQLMHKNGELLDDCENGIQKSSEKSRKKPLSCSWCPATFNLKSSLIVHVKVTHPAQKETLERKEAEKITCPVCQKTFPKESTLNQHMKAVHGEKPWQCSVCSKSFTTKYFLRKHKRIHTGETPYECNVCHKVFTFQQSYHKHMLYHTDDKPYCCAHCGRLFKELSTLNNHERIHSGEKPFACETCGKCFRQRVSYLVHRRIHTGAMPYKCTACNKSFRYKISQRTHKCPEYPPGVVVKMHNTLVDRLQAVINQGESEREGHKRLSVDSTNHSTPSQIGNLVSPSTSTLNHPFPPVQGEAQLGQDYVKIGNETVGASNSDSANGTALSGSPCSSQTGFGNTMYDGEAESTSGMNTVQTFPSLFDCSEMQAEEKSGRLVDEVDVFSMNLDSSPSECLGKLHISSSEYYDQQSTLEGTTKNQMPHPNLSFDNMEDVDLCNLFFDVP